MAPSSALRCLAITLVIGLAAIESSVQAFTIKRESEHLNTVPMEHFTEFVPSKEPQYNHEIKKNVTHEELTIAPRTSTSETEEQTTSETESMITTHLSSSLDDTSSIISNETQTAKGDVVTKKGDEDFSTGSNTMIPVFVGDIISDTVATVDAHTTEVNLPTTTENINFETTTPNFKLKEINEFSKSDIQYLKLDSDDNTNSRLQTRNIQNNINEGVTATTTEQDSTETEYPSWKKYKILDRKRTQSDIEQTTKEENNMERLDIGDNYFKDFTTLDVEKETEEAFSNQETTTSIYNSESTKNKKDIDTAETDHIRTTRQFSSTSDKENPIESTTDSVAITPRSGVMSSQRAGFLDYSSKFFIDTNPTTTATSTYVADNEPSEDTTKNDEATTYTSDRKTTTVETKTSSGTESENYNTLTTERTFESTIHDKLSVKPISDRTKVPIYTVSPFYKPLKKIEVQPQKHFIRDPDDNSWRNESLSSLGIVFNAKNSTKSFTEVLKNKTEAELNALGEKTSKEEPELRTRLEKIAEQRKSKKKKPDGTDCDERSIDCLVQQDASNRTRNEKLSKLIKEIYNYDDDDSEEDYVTLSNIDIKKYINPSTNKPRIASRYGTRPRTLSGPEYVRNEVITTQPPLQDRKPTVQYFPPRVVDKVNMHEYDDSFINKINMFTSTTTTTTTDIPLATYPTLEDYVVEIERNKLQNRLTMQPKEKRTKPPSTYKSENNKIFVTSNPNIHYTVIKTDDNINKAEYIINHLKELLNYAAKNGFDVNKAYVHTESPIQNYNKPTEEYNEYEAFLHSKFDDKFAENERHKVDYPLLYNTTVVHGNGGKGYASSSAILRRQYDKERRRGQGSSSYIDSNMDAGSPSEYDGHFLAPEQEQTEEVQFSADMLPPYLYNFRK